MKDKKLDSRRLVAALGLPVIVIGILVIAALLLLSYLADGARTVDSDEPRQLNAATMSKFRQSWDARGIAIGSKTAPITIREFGDYQCPACRAFQPTAKKIRENLVEAGKVRYIFFDFPLNMHKNALEAAIAARCAARQDKFWAYHDALYATQREWSGLDNPTQHFLNLAVQTGVPVQPLTQCLQTRAMKDVVQAQKEIGIQIGIRATPTVVVGNRLLTGAVSYDKIKQVVARQISSRKNASQSQ